MSRVFYFIFVTSKDNPNSGIWSQTDHYLPASDQFLVAASRILLYSSKCWERVQSPRSGKFLPDHKKPKKKETFLCFKSRYLLDVSQRLVTDQKPKKEFRRFILIGFSLIVFWTIQNSFSKSFFSLICLICLLFLNRWQIFILIYINIKSI